MSGREAVAEGGEPVALAIPQDPKAKFALEVVRHLKSKGFQAVWAGGCVRDLLMGLTPMDYDVATNARPRQVKRLFRRTVAVGAQFGVILVVGDRREQGEVQVATFRREGPYSDGRHPDRVVFCSMKEDALRRDFTINGMFYDPVEKLLYDFVGGREDLRRQVIRAIGDPYERFAEDKLRLIRAVRFAARFRFRIDEKTFQAVRAMAAQITQVSVERVLKELELLLQHPSRAEALRLMDEVGLTEPVLPEVASLRGRPGEDPWHRGCPDLWTHTLEVLSRLDSAWAEVQGYVREKGGLQEAQEFPVPLAMAALFHALVPAGNDVVTVERIRRRRRHGIVGQIMRRLRASNETRDVVCWLTENLPHAVRAHELAPRQWKRLLVEEATPWLLALARAEADALGATQGVAWLVGKYRTIPAEQLNPPPLLTGDRVIALGVPRGPAVGQVLQALRDAQLDEAVRTAEEAEQWVLEWLRRGELRPD